MPELALLFPAPAEAAMPRPRTRDAKPRLRPSEPHRFGRETESGIPDRSRFVIISYMKSGSISALEEEIFNLGPTTRFMPQERRC